MATLVRYAEPGKPRARFDPVSHGNWQRWMSGGRVARWVDEGLLKEREGPVAVIGIDSSSLLNPVGGAGERGRSGRDRR